MSNGIVYGFLRAADKSTVSCVDILENLLRMMIDSIDAMMV